MKFFNYIYIGLYRYYHRYEGKKSNNRFRATGAFLVCLFCYFALVIEIVSRVFNLDFQLIAGSIQKNYLLLVIFLSVLVYLTYKFYSVGRIAKINMEYEKQSRTMKKTWIWIAFLSAAVSITLFALMLNKTI
jgi:hypothetical protein